MAVFIDHAVRQRFAPCLGQECAGPSLWNVNPKDALANGIMSGHTSEVFKKPLPMAVALTTLREKGRTDSYSHAQPSIAHGGGRRSAYRAVLSATSRRKTRTVGRSVGDHAHPKIHLMQWSREVAR